MQNNWPVLAISNFVVTVFFFLDMLHIKHTDPSRLEMYVGGQKANTSLQLPNKEDLEVNKY